MPCDIVHIDADWLRASRKKSLKEKEADVIDLRLVESLLLVLFNVRDFQTKVVALREHFNLDKYWGISENEMDVKKWRQKFISEGAGLKSLNPPDGFSKKTDEVFSELTALANIQEIMMDRLMNWKEFFRLFVLTSAVFHRGLPFIETPSQDKYLSIRIKPGKKENPNRVVMHRYIKQDGAVYVEIHSDTTAKHMENILAQMKSKKIIDSKTRQHVPQLMQYRILAEHLSVKPGASDEEIASACGMQDPTLVSKYKKRAETYGFI